jgi:uncharacterized DUF497 family protein
MSEWDEAKRRANLAKHRLDFVDADLLFDGRPTVVDDARSEAELRFRTTGMVNGVLRTLIWTWRGGERRFISFRSARDEEKREYRQLYD